MRLTRGRYPVRLVLRRCSLEAQQQYYPIFPPLSLCATAGGCYCHLLANAYIFGRQAFGSEAQEIRCRSSARGSTIVAYLRALNSACLHSSCQAASEQRLLVFSGGYVVLHPRESIFREGSPTEHTEHDHARCSSTKLSRARTLPLPCLGFRRRGERARRSSSEERCRRGRTGECSYAGAGDGRGRPAPAW